ncbi:MAG: phage tail tape measure protein [Flavobacteriaceae bacterium]|nr:phage tail tape measure protein [Flavobacteriaceae bacterium]
MSKKNKLELLLELSDKLFNNKLQQVQNKLNSATDRMQGKLDRFKLGSVKTAGAIAGAFAAVGGIALLTIGMNKSINAAQDFDAAFLPIRNMNLDKSKAELDGFRNEIRNAAFEIGSNLVDSTNAVFDLQSATGLYGDDAIEVFKKVGRFSLATGANINDAMNSTTKSMKAFGLGVEDIDKLLESNAKTVQVGITTFDQLAKVQTEFAGATSAAGQSIDTGNKIFAMFTSISKSADIAANQTKTFFQGLGQQADQIKKELNIDVFDVNGNMKAADDLLKEIGGRFKSMSDEQITAAINRIGGPEGLRAALSKVKTGAEDMISTFNAFDSTTFSLKAALENAEGDVSKMREMLGNRLEAIFSKMGEKILPMIAGFIDRINPVLEFLFNNFDTIIGFMGPFIAVLGVLTAAVWAFNIAASANPVSLIVIAIAALIALIVTAIKKFDEWGAGLLLFMGPIGIIISAFKSIFDHWESIKKAFKDGGILAGLKRLGLVLLDALLKPIQQVLETLAKFDPTGLAQKALDKVKAFREANQLVTPGEIEARDKANKLKVDEKKLTRTPDTPDDDPNKPVKPNNTGPDKVAGSAGQVRNVTINIDSFNKGGINMSQEAGRGLSLQDIENWFKEAMLRVTLNAERTS